MSHFPQISDLANRAWSHNVKMKLTEAIASLQLISTKLSSSLGYK